MSRYIKQLYKDKIVKTFILQILFVILIISCSSCKAQKIEVKKTTCSTKYPIVLIHGLGLRDNLKIIKYWSKIPQVLEQHGAEVYLSNQDAFNSCANNALQLRKTILEILKNTKSEKVNLIAHSKGGLDARYMISKLVMADKVASLTTISTPHRGSFLADTVLTWLHSKNMLNAVIKFVNGYAYLFGDKNPDALAAAQNLTTDYLVDFNAAVPNMKQVYYQSFGSVVSDNYPSLKVRFQAKLIAKKEGDNDSNVSIKSCKWGNFRAVVKNANQDFGVSHHAIIGMKFMSRHSNFDAETFIVKIVEELKLKGF